MKEKTCTCSNSQGEDTTNQKLEEKVENVNSENLSSKMNNGFSNFLQNKTLIEELEKVENQISSTVKSYFQSMEYAGTMGDSHMAGMLTNAANFKLGTQIANAKENIRNIINSLK